MNWDDTYDLWQDEIDKSDRDKKYYWLLLLLLLSKGEASARKRIVRAALGVGIIRGGTFNPDDRAALRKLRTAAMVEWRNLSEDMRRGFHGNMSAKDMRKLVWDEAARGGPTGGGTTRGGPAGIMGEHLSSETARVLALLDATIAAANKKALADDQRRVIEDSITDMLANIDRNVEYHTSRLGETVVRMSGPSGRRDALLAYLDGGPTGEPWSLHRGYMRSSTVEHARALFRNLVVTSALASGIRHFRMDMPTDSVTAGITESSTVGRHAWRVRDIAEWGALVAAANNLRTYGSSFETFGFGFDDFSYLIPVTGDNIEAATAHGESLRAQHIAGRTA